MTACKRCGAAETVVTPYWAKDGHRLCAPCCVAVAEELDRRDKWPKPTWTSDDEELIP